MIDVSLQEALTESIYYVVGHPAQQTQYERILHHQLSHASDLRSAKQRSANKAITYSSHLGKPPQQSSQPDDSPLRTRVDNHQSQGTGAYATPPKSRAKSPMQHECRIDRLSRKANENQQVSISIPRPRPSVKGSAVPQLNHLTSQSLYPKVVEAKPQSVRPELVVPEIKSLAAESKLLYSKIEANSPSFSNILDEFKSQRSSERNVPRLSGQIESHREQEARELCRPQHILIKEVLEQSEESLAEPCGYSPLNIRSELEAIYRGSFKISKK